MKKPRKKAKVLKKKKIVAVTSSTTDFDSVVRGICTVVIIAAVVCFLGWLSLRNHSITNVEAETASSFMETRMVFPSASTWWTAEDRVPKLYHFPSDPVTPIEIEMPSKWLLPPLGTYPGARNGSTKVAALPRKIVYEKKIVSQIIPAVSTAAETAVVSTFTPVAEPTVVTIEAEQVVITSIPAIATVVPTTTPILAVVQQETVVVEEPKNIISGQIVYLVNNSGHAINTLEIDGSGISATVLSGHIKPFGYGGFYGIKLQAKVLGEKGEVLFESRVEDFANGNWVWVFEPDGSVRRSQDLSILPGMINKVPITSTITAAVPEKTVKVVVSMAATEVSITPTIPSTTVLTESTPVVVTPVTNVVAPATPIVSSTPTTPMVVTVAVPTVAIAAPAASVTPEVSSVPEVVKRVVPLLPVTFAEAPPVVVGVSNNPTSGQIVYLMNNVGYTVNVSEIDGSGTSAVVLNNHIKPFSYEGFYGIKLQAKILDEKGKVLFESRVEDFTGGGWVWVFEPTGVIRRTQDLAILPKR